MTPTELKTCRMNFHLVIDKNMLFSANQSKGLFSTTLNIWNDFTYIQKYFYVDKNSTHVCGTSSSSTHCPELYVHNNKGVLCLLNVAPTQLYPNNSASLQAFRVLCKYLSLKSTLSFSSLL